MFGDACLDASLTLGDCANAAVIELTASGALRVGDACVASSESGALTLEACAGTPEQYWVLDSEGTFWNGRPPQSAADMTYDHVRCLTPQGAQTCGASMQVRWTIVP